MVDPSQEERPVVPASRHELLLDLLSQFFPVTVPEATLPRIAQAWQRAFSAVGVHCLCPFPAQDQLWVSTSEVCTAESFDVPGVDEWQERLTAHANRMADGDIRWLQDQGQPVACVCIVGPRCEPQADDLGVLQELSLRALLQLRADVDHQLADVYREQLKRDKLEALAEFAAGAGHEINNPIATIVGRVQLLLQGELDPERRFALETIGGQAYRIRDMIGDAMVFARPPVPEPDWVNVVACLTDCLATLPPLRTPPIIDVDMDRELAIWGDPSQVSIVFFELLCNALEASSDPARVQVSGEVASGGTLIKVRDHGRGFSELDSIHAFDPFYSGRQAGRGLGFGLAKCWRIVSNHGGRIAIDSPPNEPTTMSVFWPSPS